MPRSRLALHTGPMAGRLPEHPCVSVVGKKSASLYCLMALHEHPPASQAASAGPLGPACSRSAVCKQNQVRRPASRAASTGPLAKPVAALRTAAMSKWWGSCHLTSLSYSAAASWLVHPASPPNRHTPFALKVSRPNVEHSNTASYP